MRTRELIVCVCAVLVALPGGMAFAAQDHEGELKAEVPALRAMHTVIYPLWHKAWPEKDFEMMKRLLPKVQEHVQDVTAAELPGILRDKQTKWDEGVAALVTVTKRYEAAAKDDQGQELLAAVEELHARFEDLMRLVRPVLKELDEYHVVLYRIYHHFWPDKDQAQLRKAAGELTERAAALKQAELPARPAGEAEQLQKAIAKLATLSQKLEAVTAQEGAWEPIERAVDAVHAQYQKVEKMLE